jgi:hypothetical protein
MAASSSICDPVFAADPLQFRLVQKAFYLKVFRREIRGFPLICVTKPGGFVIPTACPEDWVVHRSKPLFGNAFK